MRVLVEAGPSGRSRSAATILRKLGDQLEREFLDQRVTDPRGHLISLGDAGLAFGEVLSCFSVWAL
jgi:hypothetical protein